MKKEDEEMKPEDWLFIMWSGIAGLWYWVLFMNIGFIWYDPMDYDLGMGILIVSLLIGVLTVAFIKSKFKTEI